jgi:vacuolar fusion protein MON1
MQALISVFLDDGDKLRCINAGRTRISFLLRSPLYYACVSSWGEPESLVCSVLLKWVVIVSDCPSSSKTRSHLEYLHLQILSIVSAAQLRRIFERRTNFDLRRLLNGKRFLRACLRQIDWDPRCREPFTFDSRPA